ncbi:alcohol dehydrogenase catalytic domain-containing protein [Roseovarius atlanticus]|uniref:alcohol dehydrogenase catalytic domain-containing protein n=1 Tax=Roseovarius atlanticus TaxID=1641875 RepID=UPI001C94A236|nr:hypothetical protein [Roseovarius atlanticus]MBY5987787.1 hypothetical protein [Roseovarius atlanticus]MBY6123178.1 hypothetical protein [Roseovarius atlanticus]MBY6147674.1 hypothetical protein [Roseovarius atlanticus]
MEAPYRIVHDRPGAPENVLRIERTQLRPLKPGEVLVEVTRSAIHPGDLQLIAAQGVRDPAQWPRVPGLEGAGVVADAAPGALAGTGLAPGSRVAFFAPAAWQSHVVVPKQALVALPPDVPDDIAAQLLVNTVTARHVLRAARQNGGRLVQSGASSSTGKLISTFALEAGLAPIRLVRSAQSADRLAAILPGGDIVDTSSADWQERVRELAHDRIGPIIDGVGGTLLTELAVLAEPGARIVSYGRLDARPVDHTPFIAKGLSLIGVTIGTWHQDTGIEDQAGDLRAALRLGQTVPDLFAHAGSFPASHLAAAIAAAVSPGKPGNILLEL